MKAGLWLQLAGLFAAGVGIATTASGQAVPSQPYTWKSVKVVAGGYIPGVEFSLAQKNLIYCRTDIGGPYKWDDAQKSWVALIDFTPVSNYMGCESIAPDPKDANKVYIACGMGSGQEAAIFRSMDQGKTFDIVPVPFTMGGNEDGRGVGERLAIDPNSTNILYFGSRHDGLWISTDSAKTWKKVDSFPIMGAGNRGGGRGRGGRGAGAARGGAGTQPGGMLPGADGGGVGLSFVVFDPASGSAGSASNTIYVGSTDPGPGYLFRSDDAGKTWQAVAGQPTNFIPDHCQMDSTGTLYFTYDNSVGPGSGGAHGVTDGAVWRFDPKSGKWTDITPVKDRTPPDGGSAGGYDGISVDHQHPGTLLVSTFDRKAVSFDPNRRDNADHLYRSSDGGQTWIDLTDKSKRDPALSPYLIWGQSEINLGWWMSAVAIDPFDSNHAMYGTGATFWETHDLADADTGKQTTWTVGADGMEETAILSLTSPTDGAHLISAFGDIGGFTHDNLNVSPAGGMHQHPLFTNTNAVDFAEQNPKIMVRTGTAALHIADRGTMAYSEDGGHTWQEITAPTQGGGGGRRGGGGGGGGGGLALSADGSEIVFLGQTPQISKDKGKTWTASKGLPAGLRPTADRVNPAKFYAVDSANSKIFTSTDGGLNFTAADSVGLPAAQGGGGRGGGGGGGARLIATLGKEGDLWLTGRGLYHSTDGGLNFVQIADAPVPDGAQDFGFGKAAPNQNYPALFVAGRLGDLNAIWRSDDIGKTWVRVNDDQHQYGTRFSCLCGDPRVYGRVYVGTNGRGIVYGDISTAK